jgi:hypothetical protein
MRDPQGDLLQLYEREAGCLLALARECADKNVQRRLIAIAAEYVAKLVRLSEQKPIQPISH